jgi:hypothetical protein
VFDEVQAQDILVTAALMPAVLGYALLLECIVAVRKIESRKSLDSSPLLECDLVKLGDDPGPLRSPYGLVGARAAQIMCFVFVLGLVVLSMVSLNFLYGLIIVAIFGSMSFLLMNHYISLKIRLDGDDDHLYKEDGDASPTSTPPSSVSMFVQKIDFLDPFFMFQYAEFTRYEDINAMDYI